jgi:hypothetical protein
MAFLDKYLDESCCWGIIRAGRVTAMKNGLITPCIALLMSGCIATGANITLVDSKSGTIATGSISRLSTAAITVKGKEYSGQFEEMKPADADSPATMGSDIGTSKLVARAEDGSTLSCDVAFEGWISTSGTGKCQDSDGNNYDIMVITRY